MGWLLTKGVVKMASIEKVYTLLGVATADIVDLMATEERLKNELEVVKEERDAWKRDADQLGVDITDLRAELGRKDNLRLSGGQRDQLEYMMDDFSRLVRGEKVDRGCLALNYEWLHNLLSLGGRAFVHEPRLAPSEVFKAAEQMSEKSPSVSGA